jgi:hypothetical protein
MSTARDRSPRHRRLRRLAVALAAFAVMASALASPAAFAEPTDEWVPAEGLAVSVEVVECGVPDVSGGEAIITVTADDPERTWGYAVRGAALVISSPASDNSGSVEIPIGGPTGNYYVAVFHLPVNGQIPVVTTGFTIEPCEPGPPISISTTCAAEGGSAVADASITGLAPASEYRSTFFDAGGGVLGDAVAFTADASGARSVTSGPLADDAAYRSVLDWIPSAVPDPGWPTGDFSPVVSMPVSAADFAVGTCAAPATASAAPPATARPAGPPTLADSGGPEATALLLLAATCSALGLAMLVVVGRRRRAARAAR